MISQSEKFFFENNGYLVLDQFLDSSLTERLLETVNRVAAHRRQLAENNVPHTGITHTNGDSTRIFYILDDDLSLIHI